MSRILALRTPMMTGEDVEYLQSLLSSFGYETGSIDGIYGKNTYNAVKDFQHNNELEIDGIVGPKTWECLFEIENETNNKFQTNSYQNSNNPFDFEQPPVVDRKESLDPVMFAKNLMNYGADIPGETYNTNDGSKYGSPPKVPIKEFQGVIGWESFAQLDTDGSGKPDFYDPDHQPETNLQDRNGEFLNGNEIPYIVLPGSNNIRDVFVGDLGILVNTINNNYIYVIYGDKGPSSKIGEASVAAHRRLGLTDATRNIGYNKKGLIYIIFPNSRENYGYGNGNNIPQTYDEVQRNGEEIWRMFLRENH